MLAQGLLNKQPNNRLDWPELLNHPFVKLTAAEAAALDAKQSILTQRPGMKRANSSPPPALLSRSPSQGACPVMVQLAAHSLLPACSARRQLSERRLVGPVRLVAPAAQSWQMTSHALHAQLGMTY